MASTLRKLVSVNKRRYQADGHDLDLSYITDRIIAMGFPADGLSRLYRNPMPAVLKFLQSKHVDKYKVYNLCVERQYDPVDIKATVVQYPLVDGQAPPLHIIQAFCLDAEGWLAADPDNVVVVHCKAGKGRTGTLICALLLHLEYNSPVMVNQTEQHPAERAVLVFGKARTHDGRALTIPSQIRYVGYYHDVLTLYEGRIPSCSVTLDGVTINALPASLLRDCTISMWVRPSGQHETQLLKHIHTAAVGCLSPKTAKGGSKQVSAVLGVKDGSLIISLQSGHQDQPGVIIEGDLKVQVFKKHFNGSADHFKGDQTQFSVWVNTAFLPKANPNANTAVFGKAELDKTAKKLRQPAIALAVELHYH